jgi:hypothetical protein
MKKLCNYLFLAVFYIHHSAANSIEVTNLTGGQISVTIQTSAEEVSQVAPANLNPLLNDINEPDPHPITISFANNPIQKIVITRFTPNMPQTIYYDDQNTEDAQQVPGGIHSLNITRKGKMIIWQEYVEINSVTYPMTDLQSYITRCSKLQANLSSTNLDSIQKQLDDLTSTVKTVRESDMGPQLSIQITTIQTIIDAISNNIKTMKTLNDNLQTVQNLQGNLALGNNNLTATNKPYQPADDSIERAQQKLNALKIGLQTLMQSNPTGVIAEQSKALQGAMNGLQADIDQTQTSRLAINYEMLLPPSINLQAFQNT